MTPKQIAAVRRAWFKLPERIEALQMFPTPLPAPAVALMIYQESGWRRNAVARNVWLDKQGKIVGGFWEISYTQRTVGILDGSGTAKASNVNPWDLRSAVYGLQHECQGNINGWLSELPELGFTPPRFDDVHAWLILMRMPYSFGWKESRALLSVGSSESGCAVPTALARCLSLNDTTLPDIGPVSDDKIRKRIHNVLAFPYDAAKVGPLPPQIGGFPQRLPCVLPMPEWKSIIAQAERIKGLR